MSRCFNFEANFKLRWCRGQDLTLSQIPEITGGFELQISCIWGSGYLTHETALWSSSLGDYFVSKRLAVQTLLRSLKFVIQNISSTTPSQIKCRDISRKKLLQEGKVAKDTRFQLQWLVFFLQILFL